MAVAEVDWQAPERVEQLANGEVGEAPTRATYPLAAVSYSDRACAIRRTDTGLDWV
jgi:hypothetical protein